MIKRIVKMNFREEEVPSFMEVFEASKHAIRSFPGCHHLELLQSKSERNILFTFSVWENEDALENYRQSELFITTWRKTKVLFSEKAEAWTLEMLHP